MTIHLLGGDPPISLNLRRSARARRMTLRVSQLDGRVTLTVPERAREVDALDFAMTKADWIRKHLARRIENIVVAPGAQISVEGQPHEIQTGHARGVRRNAGVLHVHPDRPGARVQAYLKELARDRLTAASDSYAATLGRHYSRLQLRDTRSRWGSCSSNGTLSYSWRLIMAPPKVLRYVAAHEVAHLAEMNHSPAFWAIVTELYGEYAAERDWLRAHGADLHRYQFELGS